MTTLTLPAPPTTARSRLKWTLKDGATVVGRDLGHLRREPGQLIAALLFPAILVLLFGYIFGSAIKVPGGGNYREYLMPGLFAMTAVTGIIGTTLGIAADVSKGVMDRFRSMPMARSAVPFGQTGSDILVGIIGLVIMAGCGLAVGWRAHNGFWQTLAGFALLISARYAISWGGVLLGLSVKSEETADQLVPLVFPITMIGNAFVPTTGMPTWLRIISEWNPVSALTGACRQLFGNPGAHIGHGALPLQHPIAATLIWIAVLLALFVPLSVRKYGTKNR